jgi:hypothetical protein
VQVYLLLPPWLSQQFSHQVKWSQKNLPWFPQSHDESQQIWQSETSCSMCTLSGIISNMILQYLAFWIDEIIVWCTPATNRLINSFWISAEKYDKQPDFPETESKYSLIRRWNFAKYMKSSRTFLGLESLNSFSQWPQKRNSVEQESKLWHWHVLEFLSSFYLLLQFIVQDGHQLVHFCSTPVPALPH